MLMIKHLLIILWFVALAVAVAVFAYCLDCYLKERKNDKGKDE